MVRKCASHNIGFGKIATEDGGFLLQLLFSVAVISIGIFVELNVLQWTTVLVLTLIFLFIGIYRSATNLVISHDNTITFDQAHRLKAMSNMLLAFMTGVSFFTYLLIFIPKINQLLL